MYNYTTKDTNENNTNMLQAVFQKPLKRYTKKKKKPVNVHAWPLQKK